MKRTYSNSATSGSSSQQRRSPSPVNTTPAVEPVEQRWEESEGTYLHKKFKKMASAVQSVDSTPEQLLETAKDSTQKTNASTSLPSSTITTTAIPVVPIPTVIFEKPDLSYESASRNERRMSSPSLSSQFPLKHSALSMLQPSTQPIQTTPSTMNLSSRVYVPAPSPSPSKMRQQIPLVVTQQVY